MSKWRGNYPTRGYHKRVSLRGSSVGSRGRGTRAPRGPRGTQTRVARGTRGRGGGRDYGQTPEYDGYHGRSYQPYDISHDYNYQETSDTQENNNEKTEENDPANVFTTVDNLEDSNHPSTSSHSKTYSTSTVPKIGSSGSAVPVQRHISELDDSPGRYPELSPVRPPLTGSKTGFQLSPRQDGGHLYLKRSRSDNQIDSHNSSSTENHKRKFVESVKPARNEVLSMKKVTIDNIISPAKLTNTLSFKNPASTSLSLSPRLISTGEKLNCHDPYKTPSTSSKQIEISFRSHKQGSPKRESVSPIREAILINNTELNNGPRRMEGSEASCKIHSLSPSCLPSSASLSIHRQESNISFRSREKENLQKSVDNEEKFSKKGKGIEIPNEQTVVQAVSPNLKLNNDQTLVNNAKQNSINVPDTGINTKNQVSPVFPTKNLSFSSSANKNTSEETKMNGVTLDSNVKCFNTTTVGSQHTTKGDGKESSSSKQSSLYSVKEQHFNDKKSEPFVQDKTKEKDIDTKESRLITSEGHNIRSKLIIREPISIPKIDSSKLELKIVETPQNLSVDSKEQKFENGIIASTTSQSANETRIGSEVDIVSGSTNAKQSSKKASFSASLKMNGPHSGSTKEDIKEIKTPENQPTKQDVPAINSVNLPRSILSFLGVDDGTVYSSYKDNESVIKTFSLLQNENIPSSQANLNIFDFDHTMTSTLTPNPELYTDTTHSYLLASNENCVSWYNDVLPSLELEPKVMFGGIAPSHCKGQYCAALEDAIAGPEFENHESLKTLNYQWSKTLLYMVRNLCASQIASNVLIIDRYVKNISKLKADLDSLNEIGIKFHYVLYMPHKNHPDKPKNLTLSLLEEIYHTRFPWSRLTKTVTIFRPFPGNLDRSKLSKFRFLSTPGLDLRAVYTAKRCAYVKEPSTEVKHVYTAALNDKRFKLTMSISGAVFRLAYSSASSLINYLDSIKFFPVESSRSEYLFNFTDVFITYNKLPGKAIEDLGNTSLYDGAILQYGQAGKSLYAVQFLISTENVMWEYEAPIMIVARDRSISIAAAKKILKKMDWTLSDSSLNLKFTFFPSSKLKITQT